MLESKSSIMYEEIAGNYDLDRMGIISGLKEITGGVKDFFSGLSEEAFAGAGAAAYAVAATTIAALNLNVKAQKLDDDRRALFRSDFDDLVDQCDIMFGARMVELEIMGRQIGTNPAAQTFGKTIYVEQNYRAGDANQLRLLAHELVHVRQTQQEGGMQGFGYKYFKEFYRAGFSYSRNEMEEEADRFANCFMHRRDSNVKLDLKYESDWKSDWTNLIPYKIGAEVLLILYSARSGRLKISRVLSNATAFSTVFEGTWDKGWSTFMPYVFEGSPHCVVYNARTGRAKGYKLTDGAPSILWADTWTDGWTTFMPFMLSNSPHYLSYKRFTGRVHIGKLTSGIPERFWEDEWKKGWTTFMPFSLGDAPHYLAYKRYEGTVHFSAIKSDGKGTTSKWNAEWTKGWTDFIPLSATGRHYLAYKGPNEDSGDFLSGNGLAHISAIGPDLRGSNIQWCDIWRGTWRTVVSFDLSNEFYFLLYGANMGHAKLYKFND